MKAKRFASTAPSELPHFAPKIQIVGFGIAVGLVLLTAFNGQDLSQRMAESKFGDAVGLAYLRIWTQARPDAYHLHLVLARHELWQGNLQRAVDALTPILRASDVESDDLQAARTLLLQIRKMQLWQLQPNSAAFQRAKIVYLRQLRQVASGHWDQTQLQHFAQEAIALGDAQLGYELYVRLIKNQPCQHLQWYERIAGFNLGAGRYERAAQTYFQMSSCITDSTQQQTLIVTGLQALQAGNRLDEAMLASEKYFALLSQNPKTLMYLAKLALASNRPDLAEKYMSQVLQQRITSIQRAP